MDTNNDIINLRAFVLRYLKKWYWFALSVCVCVGLALLYIFSTPKRYEVSSAIMLRPLDSENSNVIASELSLLVGTGVTIEGVEDELQVLNSRSIMEQVIRELDIQTTYKKKKGLRWVEQYVKHDIDVVYPPLFTDTMRHSLTMHLKCKKDGYMLKFKYGDKIKTKYVLTSLSDSVETSVGVIRFVENNQLEKGDQIEMKTLPMAVQVAAYGTAISARQAKKESRVIKISTSSDCPPKAEDVINRMVELYNFSAVYDRNYITRETRMFVDERLRIVSAELDSLEKIVETYKQNHQIANIGSEISIYLDNSNEYQKRIVNIETQVNLLNYINSFLLDEANAESLIPANLGITDEALLSLIDTYNKTELRRMRIARTATAENPALLRIDSQLQTMRQNILTSITGLIDGLQIKKQKLQTEEIRLDSKIRDVPTQEREYLRICRERDIKHQSYLFLYQKKEENDITLVSTVKPAKIIDAAQMIPTNSSPNAKLLLLMAFLFGLCIPVVVIFIYDLWNAAPEVVVEENKVPV